MTLAAKLWSDRRGVNPVLKSSAPADLAQIFESIRNELDAVEEAYASHIQSRVELIPQIARYIQTSGGKRVRPAVLLMAARLADYKGDRAVLYASVVEFIHTATLVHDDRIDEAEVRRGRVAVRPRSCAVERPRSLAAAAQLPRSSAAARPV